MTINKKQEILNVVGNYGQVKREVSKKHKEIQRLQRERQIHWYKGEEQIVKLYEELERTSERKEFIEMTKRLDDTEFEKHFRSACLKEFLDINIAPEEL